MPTSKPNVLFAWAETGGTTDPGTVKTQEGWISEIPSFQNFNWVLNRSDQFNKHVNLNGVPLWDAVTTYDEYSYAKGSNGRVYRSTTNFNQGNDPTLDTTVTNWLPILASSLIGPDLARILTPVGVASAVNYLRLFNSVAGGNVSFVADGADPSVGIDFSVKGGGVFNFNSANAIFNSNIQVNGSAVIESIEPNFRFFETDAGVDEKSWVIRTVGGIFAIAAYNDLIAPISNALTIERSGTVIDRITLNATDIVLNGFINIEKNKPNFVWPVRKGAAFSLGANFGSGGITQLTPNRIAAVDNATDTLRTYAFNGEAWATSGAAFALPATAGGCDVTALNSTDVAFIDGINDQLRTYRFNGSTWAQVGSGLNISVGASVVLTSLSSTDVVLWDNTSNLRRFTWNGATWAQVGTTLVTSPVTGADIAALNSTDIAFIDLTTDAIRTYRWNGTTFVQLGNALITGFTHGSGRLSAMNPETVVYIDPTLNYIIVFSFDGVDWVQVGPVFVESNITPAICAMNPVDFAVIDSNGDQIQMWHFNEWFGELSLGTSLVQA